MDPQLLDQAREWIRQAHSVVALTGAGISAESGVPTFRGPGGLWRERRPETLATPEAFAADPNLVWEWYDWRRTRLAGLAPNAGHLALAAIERAAARFTLVTQNVDGLHDLAGHSSVLKLHGDIWTLRCTACHLEWHDRRAPLGQLPPLCRCGGMARPGVVWFGEQLPRAILAAAAQAVSSCAVLLVVGTSAVVYPAAGLIPMAREAGARVIEVNIDETPATGIVDAALRGPSGQILPLLAAARSTA